MAATLLTTGARYIGTSAEILALTPIAGATGYATDTKTDYTYDGSSWYAKGYSQSFRVQTTITRPANATPYTANDCLGGALDLGVLGPSAGVVYITDVNLEYDVAALPSGFTAQLHLYNVTPPSAYADNAAWDIPSGDRASYLGYIQLTVPTDFGSTLISNDSNINKKVMLSGTHLFAYLVVTAFTPAGNSEVLVLTVHTSAA